MVDKYTKIVLTIIALCLVGILLKPVFQLPAAEAQSPVSTIGRYQLYLNPPHIFFVNTVEGGVSYLNIDEWRGNKKSGFQRISVPAYR